MSTFGRYQIVEVEFRNGKIEYHIEKRNVIDTAWVLITTRCDLEQAQHVVETLNGEEIVRKEVVNV